MALSWGPWAPTPGKTYTPDGEIMDAVDESLISDDRCIDLPWCWSLKQESILMVPYSISLDYHVFSPGFMALMGNIVTLIF